MRYYFIVVSQDFLFHQEPVEEIIRERINHYNALKKEIDFCVTKDLGFLDNSELTYIRKTIAKPSVAVISLNSKFIDWLKLRIQYGVKGSFTSSSLKEVNSLFAFDKSTAT